MHASHLAAVLAHLEQKAVVSTGELAELVPGTGLSAMYDELARLENDGRLWRLRSGGPWYWAAKTSGSTTGGLT